MDFPHRFVPPSVGSLKWSKAVNPKRLTGAKPISAFVADHLSGRIPVIENLEVNRRIASALPVLRPEMSGKPGRVYRASGKSACLTRVCALEAGGNQVRASTRAPEVRKILRMDSPPTSPVKPRLPKSAPSHPEIQEWMELDVCC